MKIAKKIENIFLIFSLSVSQKEENVLWISEKKEIL